MVACLFTRIALSPGKKPPLLSAGLTARRERLVETLARSLLRAPALVYRGNVTLSRGLSNLPPPLPLLHLPSLSQPPFPRPAAREGRMFLKERVQIS